MVVSAKSTSRHAFFAEQDAGTSNDNLPGLHPGHEMPELRNAPRQPAAETVVHYARFAHIGSFPEHGAFGVRVSRDYREVTLAVLCRF